MSFSNLQSEKYLIDIELLSSILERYIGLRNNAQSVEEQQALEADALSLFEKLIELDFDLQKVSLCTYPSTQEMFGSYSDIEILATSALIKLRQLTNIFLRHFNLNQIQLNAIMGKLKRIYQKKSTLGLWNDGEAKFVLAESFTNLDNLSADLVSVEPLAVNTADGILTLPIRSQKTLEIKNISISSGSNGTPGNSDIEVTTNNLNIENLLHEDPNYWFEYERLDTGPLSLNLTLELPSEDIVNRIVLSPINFGTGLNAEVNDILFSTDGKNTSSVRDLVSHNLDLNAWEVNSLSQDGWQLTFIPVKAKIITIQLVQNHSYRIPVSLGTTSRDRDRFAIGLRAISIHKINYASEGAINSTPQVLPSGLYAGIAFGDVFPATTDLFDIVLDTSIDGGNTWVSNDFDTGVGSNFVLDGVPSELLWKLSVKRNDEAIKNITSFLPDTDIQRSTNSILKSVSVHNSPHHITLPEKPHQGRVFAYQSKILRRGNRHKKLLIGHGTGTNTSIHLPLDVMNSVLDTHDFHVYVNGREYENNPDNLSVGSEEWSFSDDFLEIEFDSALPADAKVELVIDEELMEFELRADGYYHKMELLFDPDKDSIEIEGLPQSPAQVTVILPRDKKLFNLGYKNIISSSVQLTSRNNTSYSEVMTRALVNSTAGSYYIDYPNGILWLHSELNNDVVRLSFLHQSGVKHSKDNYEIVYHRDGVTPWGIRIPIDRFSAIGVTDTIGSGLKDSIDIRTGIYGPRNINMSTETRAKALSYRRIIKGTVTVSDDLLGTEQLPEEIDFIDGVSEFYGLIEIEDEKTTTIAASGDLVEFHLAAGSLWYSDLGVHFNNSVVFGTLVSSVGLVNSVGDYFIAADGLVTVSIGAGNTLVSGIEISYYYKNPDFDPTNKYSIDYRKGIIYSHSTFAVDATINYKTASYKIAYDVGRNLDRYRYHSDSNSVSIRTEGMHKVNNLVKVIWIQSDTNSTLGDMANFFSPVISILGLRFT